MFVTNVTENIKCLGKTLKQSSRYLKDKGAVF